MSNAGRQIEALFKKESWTKARQIIRHELAQHPKDHWLLTRLSSTYYEERRYKTALPYVKKARKIAPKCPLVIWDYACNLGMLGHHKAAIALFKKLISQGERSIAFDECGEGIRWAKSLLNDCRYWIGISYRYLGDERRARSFIRMHLQRRKPGLPSLYSARSIRKKFPNL